MYKGDRGSSPYADTGRTIENFYFGEVNITEKMRQEFRELKEQYGYIPDDMMYEVVKKYQIDDPTNPRKDFAREIRLAVAEALDVPADNLDDVKFYSAVGTPVDHLLGVDAWVEYYDRASRRSARGTMDVTKNREKEESGHKAHVVFGQLSDMSEDEDEYISQVEDIGRRLADEIRGVIDSRGIRVA